MRRIVATVLVAALALTAPTKCGEPCEKTKDRGKPPAAGRQVCDDADKTKALR